MRPRAANRRNDAVPRPPYPIGRVKVLDSLVGAPASDAAIAVPGVRSLTLPLREGGRFHRIPVHTHTVAIPPCHSRPLELSWCLVT